VSVEIRAVNHRYLEVRVRPPRQFPDLAGVVETLARAKLGRGRIDIAVYVEGASAGSLVLRRDRARFAFRAFQSLRDELAPDEPVPFSLLGIVPELFAPPADRADDAIREALGHAFDDAVNALGQMKAHEGNALGIDLAHRLNHVRAIVKQVAQRAPDVVADYTQRLRDRFAKAQQAAGTSFDENRLLQEVALFADRIDVTEELTRLESHIAHFETLLRSEDPVGRRLDFLLQELAREANTLSAKSQDASIAHDIVDLKAEIERMREQVQNIE